jgi:hypothetical protein
MSLSYALQNSGPDELTMEQIAEFREVLAKKKLSRPGNTKTGKAYALCAHEKRVFETMQEGWRQVEDDVKKMMKREFLCVIVTVSISDRMTAKMEGYRVKKSAKNSGKTGMCLL